VKEGIHPNYEVVEARCACGNTFTTRSTKSELHLEICSACHPFFTGRQKLIDTEGRVERFSKKFGLQTSEQRKVAAKAKPKVARVAPVRNAKPIEKGKAVKVDMSQKRGKDDRGGDRGGARGARTDKAATDKAATDKPAADKPATPPAS
jgi:large subunit ribosomal protein L31